MTDRFAGVDPEDMTGPIIGGAAVTPGDATDIAQPSRVVYVGTGGHLAVRLISGQNVTFQNVASGAMLPIRVDRVLSTGTTATGIVVLY